MAESVMEKIRRNERSKSISLNLSKCDLSELPEELARCTWLEELDLTGNSITDLSLLREFPQIKRLYLSSTHIKSIYALSWLKNLQLLSLSSTSVENINVLEKLPELRELFLSDTPIEDITVLSELRQLQKLNLNNTRIRSIVSIRHLKRLYQLDLVGTNISDISPVSDLEKLKYCDLSHTKISDISALQSLAQMEQIKLNNTKVKDTLPLKGLKNLKSLDLGYSKIHEVSVLSGMKNLQQLNLRNTQVKDISSLKNTNELYDLDLSGTKVYDISSLGKLTQLQKVVLSNTQIEDISPIRFLQKIRFLDLSRSKVKSLEPVLHLIDQQLKVYLTDPDGIDGIYVKGCPLNTPTRDIIEKGNSAVLHYFRELQEGDVLVHEAKLLIIGDAGVGKTTLARKIVDPKSPMPDEVADTTVGIDIIPHNIAKAGKPVFTMHIWDFGGQAIYHSLHHFFFTRRSLYILILDSRLEANPDYWLQVYDLLGEDSRMLMLVNQKGKFRHPIDSILFKNLKRKYKNLQEPLHSIDLSTDNKKVISLVEEIYRNMYLLPQFQKGEKVPRKWINVRRRLEEKAKTANYISLDDYRNICREEEIEEVSRQDFLSDILHSLGVILHFYKEPILKNIVILRPTWATNAVYKVLDHTQKSVSIKGHFHKSELNSIWGDPGYRDVSRELLSLLKKFGLCYEIKAQKEFIVPKLLPMDEPSFKWRTIDKSHVLYKYEFMPRGIFSLISSRLSEYMSHYDAIWRSGVIFHYDKPESEGYSDAFIKEERNSHSGTINIEVKGTETCRNYLFLRIIDTIELTNSYFNLYNENVDSIVKYVPCICTKCKHSHKPYFFKYRELQKAEIKGISNVQCMASFEQVSISQLLIPFKPMSQ